MTPARGFPPTKTAPCGGRRGAPGIPHPRRWRAPAGARGARAAFGAAGRALGLLLLALGLLLEELLTRPEPRRPAPRPPRGRRSLAVVPAYLREEWAGDLAEVCE